MIDDVLKFKLLQALNKEIERSIEPNYWEWIDQLLEVMIKIEHLTKDA